MQQIYMISDTKVIDYSGAFHQKKNSAYFDCQTFATNTAC